MDIDARNQDNVSSYLKIMQRISRVKGFSPSAYNCFEKNESFCLDGNRNGIQFRIYDLGSLIEHRFRGTDADRKEIKSIVRQAGRCFQGKGVAGKTEGNPGLC